MTGKLKTPHLELHNHQPSISSKKEAVVIGGGIAGASAGYALAKRGWKVTIIERHKRMATQASGNPAGILFPQLNKQWDNPSRFYMAGFEFSCELIKRLQGQYPSQMAGEFCGMFQMAKNDGDAKILANIVENAALSPDIVQHLTAQQASDVLGFNVSQSGLFFPTSGWVNVPAFCHALAKQPNITTMLEQEAISLQQVGKQWNVLDRNNNIIASAEQVIIANAYDATHIEQCSELPLHTIGGQVTYIDEGTLNKPLKHIICHNGYIIPAYNGQHCLGATYRYERMDSTPISKEEQGENLANLAKYCPELLSEKDIGPLPLNGRAALRSVSRDRLPIVGMLANHTAIKEHCYSYGKKMFLKNKTLDTNSLFYSGLWISIAHASRGIISAPLAGEMIAAQLSGDAVPVKEEIMTMLHSSRFAAIELRHI